MTNEKFVQINGIYFKYYEILLLFFSNNKKLLICLRHKHYYRLIFSFTNPFFQIIKFEKN